MAATPQFSNTSRDSFARLSLAVCLFTFFRRRLLVDTKAPDSDNHRKSSLPLSYFASRVRFEHLIRMPACFIYGDADKFRESFNARTLFQSASVVSYKGG
jgi:hypothetical protein